VDDNPVERAQMKALCPEVIVPDFPDDCANLSAFMRHVRRLYFPVLHLTEEDRQKTAQYQAEAARHTFAQGLSVEEYLKGLDLWADIHEIRESEITRVAQLSQKTNQFNVCTNRYTVEDVQRFVRDRTCHLMTVHAGDRFGEQGLVAFVLASVDGSEAELVDWVMSCRTMNRTLEYAVENEVEQILAKEGIATLRATYRPTPKNEPVMKLFDRFGFTEVAHTATETSYELLLPRTTLLPHQFTIKGE
jgi:FkbH-like protein